MNVKPLTVKSLKLGDIEFNDISAFEEYSADRTIMGNIGNELLKDVEITTDFARGLARFLHRRCAK